MAGEGDCAGQGEEVAEADACEEVVPGGSGRSGEEKEAGEGQESAEGGRPARGQCVGGTKGWDDCKQRNEDDHHASDKRGFRRSREGQAGGLELVAGGQEEADDEAGDQGPAFDVAKLAAVHHGQSDERQGHAEEVEEKGRCVVEGVFDEDEGGAPDDDDRQQKEVGQSGVGEAAGHSANSPVRLNRLLRH